MRLKKPLKENEYLSIYMKAGNVLILKEIGYDGLTVALVIKTDGEDCYKLVDLVNGDILQDDDTDDILIRTPIHLNDCIDDSEFRIIGYQLSDSVTISFEDKDLTK